jgi:ketosteroid isomerase-like protein
MLATAGVEEEVIAMTKAQWAAEIAGDSEGSNAIMADDYTEFNAVWPTRVDGKALVTRLGDAAAQSETKMVAGEMANPKVQVYGDTAVLTYNFFGMNKSPDGDVTPFLAKSTRVYVKQGGTWKLVHANFAPVGGDDD